MQSKTGFPSSHQLYVAPKSRLKFAARCPVSSCWPSCFSHSRERANGPRLELLFFSRLKIYNGDASLAGRGRGYWTTRGCHRRLCVLSFPFWRHLRDRELCSPRVGNPRVGVSASCPVTAGETVTRRRRVFSTPWSRRSGSASLAPPPTVGSSV